MKGIDVLRRCGGGSSGGGTSTGGLVLTDDSVIDTRYAVWTISFDGFTYAQEDAGAAVRRGAWITPQVGMSEYDVKVVAGIGDLPPAIVGAYNAWQPMSGAYSYGWTAQDHEKEGTITVTISRHSDNSTILKTATIYFFNAGIL